MRKAMFPVVIFVVILAVPLVISLRGNQGHFVYTLDDPYIHLALSRNIVEGHYGINPGESTAPSSSVLWPFLLVPFAWSVLTPLVLNSLFAVATVILLSKFFRDDGTFPVIACIFAFNVAGLVLTGMEHSLQLLLVSVVALGVSSFRETGRVAPWFAWALVLAPLVRYECLAVTLPVLFLLFVSGHRKHALAFAGLTAVSLGSFSVFLVNLGLDPLPASVSAKSSVVSGSGSLSAILDNLTSSICCFRGLAQMIMLVPLAFVAFSPGRTKQDKLLAWTVAGSVLLHLMVGRSGWFHRYGVYMWAFSTLMIVVLFRDFVHRYVLLFSLALLVLSADYLSGFLKIPAAAANIYQQQYQMQRFVHNWLQEPVAVNDLGLVCLNSDEYVLDLWGLATPAALEGALDSAWVDSAAMVNSVDFAMVYRDELPGIQHWTQVARMEISPPLVVCVSGGVDFLAAPWAFADSLRCKLTEFSETLPDGIELRIFR